MGFLMPATSKSGPRGVSPAARHLIGAGCRFHDLIDSRAYGHVRCDERDGPRRWRLVPFFAPRLRVCVSVSVALAPLMSDEGDQARVWRPALCAARVWRPARWAPASQPGWDKAGWQSGSGLRARTYVGTYVLSFTCWAVLVWGLHVLCGRLLAYGRARPPSRTGFRRGCRACTYLHASGFIDVFVN